MDNAIYHVNKEEYALIKERIKTNNLYVAEIQGDEVQNLESYLREVWEKFKFPKTGYVNHDAYLDWIRDLDWINRDGYIMAIFDFNKFLMKSPELKNEIIEDFTDVVLPWWQGEVEKYVVEGKAKTFNLYLID